MSKDTVIGFRVAAADLAALKRAAEADARPVSALVRKIITDWLKRHAPAARNVR
jgi:predicted DNA binding CopG/RHH family protein